MATKMVVNNLNGLEGATNVVDKKNVNEQYAVVLVVYKKTLEIRRSPFLL